MLSPRWSHVRRGPLFRGGVPLARIPGQVWLMGQFIDGSGEVTGFRRMSVALRCRRVDEFDRGCLDKDQPVLRVFSGDSDHFRSIRSRRQAIAEELWAITSPRWRRLVAKTMQREYPICLNVRRGRDFSDARSQEDYYLRGAIRTPLEWFTRTLATVRQHLGTNTPTIVVSDGSARDLAPLLSLPNVSLFEARSAIAGLWAVSRSRLVIASGGSTFCAWAGFLGGGSLLSHPGQSFGWYGLESSQDCFVETTDGSSLGPQAARVLEQGLRPSRVAALTGIPSCEAGP